MVSLCKYLGVIFYILSAGNIALNKSSTQSSEDSSSASFNDGSIITLYPLSASVGVQTCPDITASGSGDLFWEVSLDRYHVISGVIIVYDGNNNHEGNQFF